MRKIFFVILLMLALPAILFSSLESGAGYVLIAVGDKTIEIGFLVAVIINLLIFAGIYFAIGLLRSLFSTRRGVLGWARSQRQQRGLNRTTQGLIAFVEGRWDFARKSLDKAAGNASTPLINYLFAARASSAMGDAKAVDTYLKQAELSTEGADVAIGLTQAELQIHNGQYEQALATLLRAKKLASHHPVVLNLLQQVYRQLNDWDSLLKLLPAMRKAKSLSAAELLSIEQEACCAKLKRSATNDSAEELMACWKNLPGDFKKDVVVIACYASELIEIEAFDEAERVLRSQLHREYHPQLINLYGLAAAPAADKQLSFAKKLLKANSDDASLLLALARISMNKNQLDEAKAYLQQSIDAGGAVGTYAELGAICAQAGEYQQSAKYYAEELAQQAKAGKDKELQPLAIESGSLTALAAGGSNSAPADKALFTSTDSLSAISVR